MEEKQKHKIQVRLTPQERDVLTAAAERERRSLPNFLVTHGLAAANRTAVHWADCAGGSK